MAALRLFFAVVVVWALCLTITKPSFVGTVVYREPASSNPYFYQHLLSVPTKINIKNVTVPAADFDLMLVVRKWYTRTECWGLTKTENGVFKKKFVGDESLAKFIDKRCDPDIRVFVVPVLTYSVIFIVVLMTFEYNILQRAGCVTSVHDYLDLCTHYSREQMMICYRDFLNEQRS